MYLSGGMIEVRFLRRPNRFTAVVERNGVEFSAHVANSGRLGELLIRENRMFVSPAASPTGRKTLFDLALVEIDGVLVSADSRLPNGIVAEAAAAGLVPELAGYDHIRREVTVGGSRIDLRLDGPQGSCYVETKSVTLVVDGVARFPDARTERGRKHVLELRDLALSGSRAVVFFVVQRPDAVAFAVDVESDPALFAAVAEAMTSGVEVYAYSCEVDMHEIRLSRRLPVVAPVIA
jgi:sugar fermentation stimulation protein A